MKVLFVRVLPRFYLPCAKRDSGWMSLPMHKYSRLQAFINFHRLVDHRISVRMQSKEACRLLPLIAAETGFLLVDMGR